MQGDNTNLQPPNFAPTVPIYPPLEELVRVTGIVSGGVYEAFIEQFTPPLGVRDRVACYVYEPNGFKLQPGIYDCRLVSNFNGLPLFAVCCCQALK